MQTTSVSETPQKFRGIETKIIQIDNDPSVINAVSDLWGMFGWNVSNVQITHSQDSRTYTKGFSDYYLGMRTVETTTINYATLTMQRDKGIANYQQIAELQEEYDNLTAALGLINGECPNQLNIPLVIAAFVFFWPVGLYLLYKHNKEKNEWKNDVKNTCIERYGTESQIHERQRRIIAEVAEYMR